jgi:eukaryotic-like serine/threonine-protein kinase
MSVTQDPVITTPAESLAGRELPGSWTVLERIEMPPVATGGNFSCAYRVVSKNGTKAFLKALDYSRALSSADPARELERLTAAYNFERDVVAACRELGMDRVVRAITDGRVTIEGAPAGGVVEYLIFELADGDVRAHLSAIAEVETAWKLRCLHHIATGLRQLHSAGIAHQDVKPSNVMVFDKKTSKVGDLGRAARKGHEPPTSTVIVLVMSRMVLPTFFMVMLMETG